MTPYRGHLEIRDYPESRVILANCGHRTWLSPPGEPYLDKAYTCCTDCAHELLEDDTDDGPMVAVPGALAYIAKHHGAEGIDVALDLIKKYGVKAQG